MTSLYRLSTANTFDSTIANITRRQSELAFSQEQLSSGKRVIRASDDAVAATLAERARSRLDRVQFDQRALEASRTALQQVDTALGESTDLMQQARELIVQGGNAILTKNIREDLALQLEGIRERLIDSANRQDTSNQALFGALGGSDKPFGDLYGPPNPNVQFRGQNGQYAATPSSLPRNLDGERIFMRVAQGNGNFSMSVEATNTGQVRPTVGKVFDAAAVNPVLAFDPNQPLQGGYRIGFTENPPDSDQFDLEVFRVDAGAAQPLPETPILGPIPYVAGQTLQFEGIEVELRGVPITGDSVRITASQPDNIFSTLTRTIDALRFDGPSQQAYLAAEVERALLEVDTGLDRMSAARGRVGDWLNRADSLDTQFRDRELSYEGEISSLTDLDFVRGLSEFQTKQTGIQAALQSYAQIQRLSLFNFIG
jgi:flagellar hook-associated protein 3 FlgL